ncbi:WD40 repeat domain-containing protein, partial [Pantanalinema sp. GBBB05]|uniref:WD40 repeat domain-containing protein n=1 Tax=Pantanalinema sp. GBBB05 TaxID=2604139 RepID=UPI001D2B70E5|nr:hypothetical protein [Pantanalinema sp. GBBB05]
NTVKLWDVGSGRLIRTLTGHSSYVNSVEFSPDSKTLASSSGDKTVKLWEVDSGKLIRTLTGHSSAIYSVGFSPDGKTLASSSEDKTTMLWRLDTDFDPKVLRQRGCNWVRSYLQNNPNVSESDRHICDGVATEP